MHKPIGFVKSSLNLSAPTSESFFFIILKSKWLKYFEISFLKVNPTKTALNRTNTCLNCTKPH